MSPNPYSGIPKERFWRFGVAASDSAAPPGIYRKKWAMARGNKVATAGSCFAQHIGRHLRKGGFSVVDMEPAPLGLPDDAKGKFGYGLYSARYGNIYTSRQLLQLAKEAFGELQPADAVWEKDGRFYDACRPAVEPDGLSSPQEVIAHRGYHLAQVRRMFLEMDVFVFTLGLTECWIHWSSGTVYPTVPGSVAGTFDSEVYVFRNLTFSEIHNDMKEFFAFIQAKRDGRPYKVLLTVSPVPLTATATEKHVLQATVYSKSVLRAVAGQLEAENTNVDYYPSYEIITNPWSTADFFEANKRSVSNDGVSLAMKTFMDEHTANTRPTRAVAPPPPAPEEDPDGGEAGVVCEEELLARFASGATA